jgi:hypothetical protein
MAESLSISKPFITTNLKRPLYIHYITAKSQAATECTMPTSTAYFA